MFENVKQVKRLLLGVRGAGLLLWDAATDAIPVRKTTAVDGRERVLVVRLDRIGDFLLWLDAARALRTLFPPERCELTLLAHPAWADLARAILGFDHVWTLQPRRFAWNLAYRARWRRRVRQAGFAVLVQARGARELLVEDSLTRATRAPVRVGLARTLSRETRLQKPLSDPWYTELVAGAGSELETNAALMRGLGLTHYKAQLPQWDAPPAPSNLMDALAGQPYFVLFPGATWSGRRWPVPRFAALAEQINRGKGWAGVVCGGPEDVALGEQLSLATNALLHNWAGRTDLTQLAGVLGGAQLVVSNETAGVHMAAVVGTPTVCILGGGHFGRFVPYPPAVQETGRRVPLPVFHAMPCFGCNWQCIYPLKAGEAAPCIAHVTTEMAWQGVQNVLHLAPRSARNAPMGV